MTNPASPPGWHADPFGRYPHRWWDGARWTAEVSDAGGVRADPAPIEGGHHVDTGHGAADVQRQVARTSAAGAVGAGTGSLWDEPVLVVNQKAKLIELVNEYAVFDADGRPLGSVRQVGQSQAKKALRFLTDLDQYMTHQLAVYDAMGTLLLQLTRPAKVFKSTIVVQDLGGGEVGRIVQENVFGKIGFALVAGGHRWGTLQAENWRAWDFHVADHAGTEVARITKTWEGLARTMFTTADNYVVQRHVPLADPLRALVLATALTVDTALKQDSRGFN